MEQADVVVCGLGAAGTAALHRLAARGLRVIGLERFQPGHDRGSSHGATRIFRLGYFERPSYVPLLRHALHLWKDLERQSGAALLQQTGILEMGPPQGHVAGGSLHAARLHGLPHEVLDAAGIRRRFPQFTPHADDIGLFQRDGGVLSAARALETQLTLAKEAGAQARFGETVIALEPGADGVRVRTATTTIAAAHVVVAVGPWLGALLPELALPLRVTRQVTGWFTPRDPDLFSSSRCPVFLFESVAGVHYGFPQTDEGVKVAKHHHADEAVDPDTVSRAVTATDEALICAALRSHVPAADGALRAAQTCLYTMTPDGDFILDHMPGDPRIVIASACSGHGFKFAPLTGDIIADLVTRGTTPHDIARFTISRLRTAPKDGPPIARNASSQ